ncbi:MAG: IS1595 family transposase [Tepidisphaeraceae bacterium]
MNKITTKSQKGQNVPSFTEDQAREFFEVRRWPDGPFCPHCASVNVYRLNGQSQRPGLLECRDCKGNFTVTVGTVMEDSHLPLSFWAKAFHLIASSKKGFSALQLQRNLGLGSYRTAWFMGHRIREAMRAEPVAGMLKGKVQVDESYVGGKPRPGTGPHKRGRGTAKAPVMVLVESGEGGQAHSRYIQSVDGDTAKGTIREMVADSSAIFTDELAVYNGIGSHFKGGHTSVNHAAGQYVGPNGETTNTAESYFALLKRGHYGVYHKMSKKHLHRYCGEFDFRWNGRTLTDADRRDEAIKGAEGKRLMYKSPIGGTHLVA